MYRTFIGEYDESVYSVVLKFGEKEIKIKNIVLKEDKTERYKQLKVKYNAMKSRCNSVNTKDYCRYGGRGIIIDSSFDNFDKFFKWAINNRFQPNAKLELDRKDNDGNYSTKNCRWVSGTVNRRNSSRSKLSEEIVYSIRYGKYKDMSAGDIATKFNCAETTIKSVLEGKTWKEV